MCVLPAHDAIVILTSFLWLKKTIILVQDKISVIPAGLHFFCIYECKKISKKHIDLIRNEKEKEKKI